MYLNLIISSRRASFISLSCLYWNHKAITSYSQLHNQVDLVLVLEGLQQLYDIGVGQPGTISRFLSESQRYHVPRIWWGLAQWSLVYIYTLYMYCERELIYSNNCAIIYIYYIIDIKNIFIAQRQCCIVTMVQHSFTSSLYFICHNFNVLSPWLRPFYTFDHVPVFDIVINICILHIWQINNVKLAN